jgi:hypothetical protein
MRAVQFDTSLALPMTTTRPTLKLDEQSFHALLAAAFTIQEHNDKASRTVAGAAKPQPQVANKPERVVAIRPEPVSAITKISERRCPRCAAPLKEDEARCGECGRDEYRPDESMQREFASLWEMSQEHKSLHERAPESVLELASSAPAFPPAVAKDESRIGDTEEEAPLLDSGESDELSELERRHLTDEFEIDSESVAGETVAAGRNEKLRRYWRALNLPTADAYLGIAIVVAVLAILWPAPATVHRQGLEPWQRILVNLGIAEAPAPQTHYRGDPNLQVWVDPHTALYYCPGEEQFGKSANGRLEAQREAQLDQFEPAGRVVCQ